MRVTEILRTWRVAGAQLFAELTGGLIARGAVLDPLVTITYSASMTPELSSGNMQTATISDGVAFAINAPLFGAAAMSATNPGTGLRWSLMLRNASGGAAGAITPNAVFKLNGAAWPAPANGQSTSVTFKWDGTNHVEIARQTAVPN